MKTLKIENFKCFQKIEVPLNDLTVLAGANGNGKSTVMQALLLLRSSIERCSNLNGDKENYSKPTNEDLEGVGIELNGNYNLSLGYSEYVIPKNSNSSVISFSLSENATKFGITFEAESSKLFLKPITVAGAKRPLVLFQKEFYYLNAERLGPRIRQDIKYTNFLHVGFQGEYTAQILGDTSLNYSLKVDEGRKHVDTSSPRLEQQVNAWLSDLMPGVTVQAKYSAETMSAQLEVSNRFTQSSSVLAPNIGFGISYVLPIIVTGLIASKGAFMLVENPEAHLHPSAQSKIGEFLAKVANTGVNIIIETHSDHVLNGIQIAVAKKEIAADRLVVNYLSQGESKGEPQPKLEIINVTEKGELEKWPRGFFDQSQSDYAKLFALRKGVNNG